eukprot:CAMPEP_0115531312 /NCGR_PEP_ID=MMETSP0271-20121206/84971_1 /TAXON_ID=71861 /ORGANISM="Scrippsiella trochoidea, Strain CCMP3099" /LENGTH=242 /DNA_ID=CAMNT_0002963519 /DNA_START=54 /DNA_END=779 /DNA_ORIENTATION=-
MRSSIEPSETAKSMLPPQPLPSTNGASGTTLKLLSSCKLTEVRSNPRSSSECNPTCEYVLPVLTFLSGVLVACIGIGTSSSSLEGPICLSEPKDARFNRRSSGAHASPSKLSKGLLKEPSLTTFPEPKLSNSSTGGSAINSDVTDATSSFKSERKSLVSLFSAMEKYCCSLSDQHLESANEDVAGVPWRCARSSINSPSTGSSVPTCSEAAPFASAPLTDELFDSAAAGRCKVDDAAPAPAA